MKIAVLLCDENFPNATADRYSLPNLFLHLFAEYHVTLKFYDAFNQSIPSHPENYDCCLLSGSKFSVLDNAPWIKQLENFIQAKRYQKLVGICFGHQLIAQALGGTVAQQAWHIGVSSVKEITSNNLFTARFNHQDHVTVLPSDATLLGTSTQCQHAMFCIGKHILGMQFHPEFTNTIQHTLLERFEGEMDENTLTGFRKTLDDPVAQKALTKKVIDFIMSSRFASG